jgi:hypothetical protein
MVANTTSIASLCGDRVAKLETVANILTGARMNAEKNTIAIELRKT